MTGRQYEIVKALTTEIVNASRSPDKFCAQRVFCRGSDRYLQVIARCGVITVKSNFKGNCLLELGRVYGIGAPDKWKSFTKGAIDSGDKFEPGAAVIPQILKIAESCATGPVALMNSTRPLVPFNSEYSGVVADGDSALLWLSGNYEAGEVASATWTKAPEGVHPDSCAFILPWVHQMLKAIPPDPETGKLEQLSGVSVAYIAGPAGLRLVFRDIGIVVSLLLTPYERTVNYTLNGKLFSIQSRKDGTFEHINKGGADMQVNVQEVKKAMFNPLDLQPTEKKEEKVAEKLPTPEPAANITVVEPSKTDLNGKIGEPPKVVEQSAKEVQDTIKAVVDKLSQEDGEDETPTVDGVIADLAGQLKEAVASINLLKRTRTQEKKEVKSPKALEAENAKLKAQVAKLTEENKQLQAKAAKFKALENIFKG